jgi:membrane-associated phospholipid phosphatase
VVVVADGVPPSGDAILDRLAATPAVSLVRLPEHAGKGDAVAAGAAALAAWAQPPDALIVVDADGQHPPGRVPAFVEAAAGADIVIGDRSGDRRSMPWTRRITNAVSSGLMALRLGRPVPDSQCGMRLIRLDALEHAPLPPGRYEAETHHLRLAAKAGLTLAWVPIPAIYDGASSSFRPVRDTARVLRALVGRVPAPGERERRRLHLPSREFNRTWGIRLGMVVAGTMVVGALMPLLTGADERAFVAVNHLGAGPQWLYEALDPHSRNYFLLGLTAAVVAAVTRIRAGLAVAFAVLVAGVFSDILVQLVYLLYDRQRPEEILGSDALLATPERTWAHIASFPSGHLVVTTAIAVAGMTLVPRLRPLFWAYVGLIALTRITFGAHYPLDVIVGAIFGYYVGLFSAWLPSAIGMTTHTPVSAFPRVPVPRRARAAPSGTPPV